jgi:hypothetical protein
MHPFLYELDQVHVDIQQHHRDAWNAAQVRIARQHQATRVMAAAVRLRAALGSLLIAAGERLRQVPGAPPALGVDPALPAVPTTPTGVA